MSEDTHDCGADHGHLHGPDGAVVHILPAEYFGYGEVVDGHLFIGGCPVPVDWADDEGDVLIYVRRNSANLAITEIHLASHDGLMQEELEEEDRQAAMYPGGPKEYHRSRMVGRAHECGKPAMDAAGFEQWWQTYMAEDYGQ